MELTANLRADLHVHTTASDGSYSPRQTALKADLAGLTALAVTDHDTTDALHDVQSELDRLQSPVMLLTGTELTAYTADSEELHLLAYGFDPEHQDARQYLQRFQHARAERVKRMVELLQQDGISVELQDVKRQAGDGAPGRVHVAKALVRNGVLPTVHQCFQELLGEGRPAYVPKFMITPEQLIPLVHSWGGVVIVAHPVYWDQEQRLEQFNKLLDCGADGFEAYHPKVDKKLRKELKKLARQRGCLITGGSDCHGGGMGRPDVGGVTVPYHFVEKLLAKIAP